MKYRMRRFLGCVLLLFCSLVGANVFVVWSSFDEVMSPDYGDYSVGLVLGASVRSDGTLSPVLQQRVDGAIQAYRTGLIQTIIVSGYDKNEQYLEAMSMSEYLLDQGVKDSAILIDSGGYDTKASAERVMSEFDKDHAIIFTQRYHLRRAVLVAKSSGLDAVGYAVDGHDLRYGDYGTSREILARAKAVVELIMGR